MGPMCGGDIFDDGLCEEHFWRRHDANKARKKPSKGRDALVFKWDLQDRLRERERAVLSEAR